MKRNRIIVLTALTALALMVAVSYAAMEKCPLCGMNIMGNENTAYEITLKDGKASTYCCPHCGLWVHGAEKGNVKEARARDFISGEWMDPKVMTFVFKSTATPACSPSWIGFGKKAEAERFVKGFGGTAFGFEDALKERAKHPKGMEM